VKEIPGPQIQAVAFDLDGLMFNTEELYSDVGGEILRRRGKQVTRELLSEMMGRQGHVALQIMIDWHQLDVSVEQLQAESDEVFDSFLDARLAPLPGLLSLLTALEEQQIPKAITTSSRRHFVDRCLEVANLAGRFQFILSAEDIQQGKPHPEIYGTAAQRFQVDTQAMLVLEDSHNGCRAAIAAGAFTVAVPGQHSRDHDFSGVQFVAEDLHDERIYRVLSSN
jgi:HAD superfamily hydrolase (TIGR01509 family)